uniref:Uncharacterized protein n=1 Tax=Anguilla anguilla TaxID=7936 RepID=A0A0E9UE54_ANGAN
MRNKLRKRRPLSQETGMD